MNVKVTFSVINDDGSLGESREFEFEAPDTRFHLSYEFPREVRFEAEKFWREIVRTRAAMEEGESGEAC